MAFCFGGWGSLARVAVRGERGWERGRGGKGGRTRVTETLDAFGEELG